VSKLTADQAALIPQLLADSPYTSEDAQFAYVVKKLRAADWAKRPNPYRSMVEYEAAEAAADCDFDDEFVQANVDALRERMKDFAEWCDEIVRVMRATNGLSG
jgi:hypothetical protein